MDDLSKLSLEELQRQVNHNEEALAWYAHMGAQGYVALNLANDRLVRLREEIALRSY